MGESDDACQFKAENFDSDLVFDFVKSIKEQSKSQDFTDVTINVEGEVFKSHRFILSACSGFFRGLFSCNMKEKIENHVVLKEVSSGIFKLILESIFENKDIVNKDNLIDVWKTCNMLQILSLVRKCENFAKDNLDVDNVLLIHDTSELLTSQTVTEASWNFVLKRFDHLSYKACSGCFIIKNSSLLDLSLCGLKTLIEDDKLHTTSEDSVIKLIIKWAMCNKTVDVGEFNSVFDMSSDEQIKTETIPRSKCAIHLLKSCRLQLASDNYLLELLSKNPLVTQTPEVRELLLKCMQFKRDGCLMYNASLETSCERQHSEYTNYIVTTANDRLEFSSLDPVKNCYYKPKIINPGFFVLTATVSSDHIYLICEDLNLYSYSLLVIDSGARLIYRNIVNDPDVSLIGDGNMLYIVGKDVGKSRSVYTESLKIKLISTNDLSKPVQNITLAFMKSFLVIVGCEYQKEDTTVIQCRDPASNYTCCLDGFKGEAHNVVVFQTLEKTYFLFGNGHLWKLEKDLDTNEFSQSYVSSLWNNVVFNLTGAVVVRKKLWIYHHDDIDDDLADNNPILEAAVFTHLQPILKCISFLDCAPFYHFSVKVPNSFSNNIEDLKKRETKKFEEGV